MVRLPLGPSVITLALAAIFVVGCGAEGSEATPPSTPAMVSPAPTEITSSPAPRALRREDVRRTVRAGLGAFLQRIQLDEHPVFENGRFKGFRIAALTGDPAFWNGVDLRPGDVVLRVNGKPIERPEQALAVFATLETAPELRVSIERGGNPRELVFPIEDAR
jgi:type II secretory pathway component PulC